MRLQFRRPHCRRLRPLGLPFSVSSFWSSSWRCPGSVVSMSTSFDGLPLACTTIPKSIIAGRRTTTRAVGAFAACERCDALRNEGVTIDAPLALVLFVLPGRQRAHQRKPTEQRAKAGTSPGHKPAGPGRGPWWVKPGHSPGHPDTNRKRVRSTPRP